MNDFSVIIVVKGNPRRLRECVGAVADTASEIIIVDIGMDHLAKESLKSFRDILYYTPKKDVPYVEIIREESKRYASNEYILFLDPDEIVSQQLLERLSAAMDSYDYVHIPRKNIIFQKWIRHSRWWPDYQIRFFRSSAVRWPTVIHAQPTVTGKGQKLPARDEYAIVHHNYESVQEYLEKLTRYTKAEAEYLIATDTHFTFAHALEKGLRECISRYFAGKGYEDGAHGLVLSFLQMFYYGLTWVYYWEMKHYPEKSGAEGAKELRTFFRNGVYETNHWIVKSGLEKPSMKVRIEKKLTRLIQRFSP